MKLPFFLLLICSVWVACAQTTPSGASLPSSQPSAPLEQDPLRFYHYNGRYLDLQSLKWVETDVLPDMEFKTHSVYAYRFTIPGWMNDWPEKQQFNGSTFTLGENGSVSVANADGEKTLASPCPSAQKQTVEDHYLLKTEKGVAEILKCGPQEMATVRLINEKGEQLFNTKLELAPHHPFIYFHDCTPRNLIYTSNDDHHPGTILLNFNTGKSQNFEFSTSGTVFSENNLDVAGFIYCDGEKSVKEFRALNGPAVVLEGEENNKAFTCVLAGDTLFLASYHPIATGSLLAAYNIRSGKKIWTADVAQLMVPHSQYYNQVFLSRYRDRIILEGWEAGGKYVQVFDALSGKRLLTTHE